MRTVQLYYVYTCYQRGHRVLHPFTENTASYLLRRILLKIGSYAPAMVSKAFTSFVATDSLTMRDN